MNQDIKVADLKLIVALTQGKDGKPVPNYSMARLGYGKEVTKDGKTSMNIELLDTPDKQSLKSNNYTNVLTAAVSQDVFIDMDNSIAFMDFFKHPNQGTYLSNSSEKMNSFGKTASSGLTKVMDYAESFDMDSFEYLKPEERRKADPNLTVSQQEARAMAKWVRAESAAFQTIDKHYNREHRYDRPSPVDEIKSKVDRAVIESGSTPYNLITALGSIQPPDRSFDRAVWEKLRTLATVDDTQVETLYKSILAKTAFKEKASKEDME